MSSIQPFRGDYLRPSFRNASVADVMTPGIISCAPETPLQTVAELMATHGVHAVAVGGVAANHLVWGIVDALDVVRALLDPGPPPHAKGLCRRPPITVSSGELLTDAARLMAEHSVTHVVVLDGDRPVGVLSTLDVAGAAAWGRR